MVLSLGSEPKSICVLRLSAVGDVCHTVPVVRAIQDHWPSARITWIIGKLESTLVGDIPGIEFAVLDKTRGGRAYRDLHREMRGKAFDLLLHMQVSLRSSLASRMIPSPVRLGFDRARARDFQWLFTTHRIEAKKHQHVMDGLFGFAQALGIAVPKPRWDIAIPERARAFAAEHVQADTRTLIISPCSTSRYRNWRNWSAEGYAAVADYAAEEHDMGVILTGGPTDTEKECGKEICRIAGHKPTNLIGKTGLKELLALIDAADVLVAPDSGPVHMATTVGTPVIGLYATSNPMRTGPYFSQQWTVNKYPEALEAELGKPVDQVPWGRRVRNPAAIDRIRVKDVTGKLDELIASLEEGGGHEGNAGGLTPDP
jgi:heptosyltransferase I